MEYIFLFSPLTYELCGIFWLVKWKGSNQLEYLGVDGKIKLE